MRCRWSRRRRMRGRGGWGVRWRMRRGWRRRMGWRGSWRWRSGRRGNWRRRMRGVRNRHCRRRVFGNLGCGRGRSAIVQTGDCERGERGYGCQERCFEQAATSRASASLRHLRPQVHRLDLSHRRFAWARVLPESGFSALIRIVLAKSQVAAKSASRANRNPVNPDSDKDAQARRHPPPLTLTGVGLRLNSGTPKPRLRAAHPHPSLPP